MADLVPHRGQFPRQSAQALAGPTQRRHRVAALIWFNQREKIEQQARVSADQRPAATPGPANPTRSEGFLGHEVLQATAYRAGRDPRHAGNRRDAPMTAGFRLNRREQTSPPARPNAGTTARTARES